MNKQAAASNQKIAVNGNPAVAESYLIDGNNYCKLRDIAYILRDTDACFQVGWLNMEKAISITTGQKYTGAGGKAAAGRKAAVSSLADIYLDGEYIQLEGYTIDGSNYFIGRYCFYACQPRKSRLKDKGALRLNDCYDRNFIVI